MRAYRLYLCQSPSPGAVIRFCPQLDPGAHVWLSQDREADNAIPEGILGNLKAERV